MKGPLLNAQCLFGLAWCLMMTTKSFACPILQTLGLLGSEAHVPPIDAAVRATQQQPFEGKVIIVGAGAAGLFAAYTLEYLGISDYEILEANPETYGGRTRETSDFIDVPLDLGAEWIHVNPKILQDLLLFEETKNWVEETFVYRPETYEVYNGRSLARFDWVSWFYAEYKFTNTTWFRYLQESVYPYVAERLHLGAAVIKIDYSNATRVAVTTQDGRIFTGTHVIVATPVTTLQRNDIVFDPPLAASKQSAFDSVDMIGGLKMWLQFEERFYADTVIPVPLHGSSSSSSSSLVDLLSHNYYLGYIDAVWGKPTDRHVLLLYQVGPGAASRVAMNETTLLADVLAELDALYDGKASASYVQSRTQNWSQEPYIRGTYSNNNYDATEMLRPLRVGDENRVYFCGEYLAQGTWIQSTVHGAAVSGRQTATRVLLDAAAAAAR